MSTYTPKFWEEMYYRFMFLALVAKKEGNYRIIPTLNSFADWCCNDHEI